MIYWWNVFKIDSKGRTNNQQDLWKRTSTVDETLIQVGFCPNIKKQSEFLDNSKSCGNHTPICHMLISLLNLKFAYFKDFCLVPNCTFFGEAARRTRTGQTLIWQKTLATHCSSLFQTFDNCVATLVTNRICTLPYNCRSQKGSIRVSHGPKQTDFASKQLNTNWISRNVRTLYWRNPSPAQKHSTAQWYKETILSAPCVKKNKMMDKTVIFTLRIRVLSSVVCNLTQEPYSRNSMWLLLRILYWRKKCLHRAAEASKPLLQDSWTLSFTGGAILFTVAWTCIPWALCNVHVADISCVTCRYVTRKSVIMALCSVGIQAYVMCMYTFLCVNMRKVPTKNRKSLKTWQSPLGLLCNRTRITVVAP